MQTKLIITTIVIAVFFSQCISEVTKVEELPEGVEKVDVTEVIAGQQYVYFKGNVEGKEMWFSAMTTKVEIGQTYYFKNALEMRDFRSKELNRTFETILFLNEIKTSSDFSLQEKTFSAEEENVLNNVHSKVKTENKTDITIESEKGAISIAELFAHRDKYASKTVKIKAKVVKFNAAIMKTNWIHLQDGTEYEGNYDLTVTSTNVFTVGDIITIEGVVAINKDFGAGYSYKVIVENAK